MRCPPRTGRLVQYVAHATRPPKTHDTPETLLGRWQQEARQRGLDPERLMREVSGRELSPSTVDGRTVGRVFDQLASPEGLTANASTFARRDVLIALGGQLAATSPAELERLADRFLAERGVSVMAEHAAGERRYATPELLQVEQRLLTAAVSRASEQTAVASYQVVREALAAHPTIAGEQAAMVRDLCQGGSGVQVVVGKAGTGKTYTLGSPGTPGSWTATECSARRPPGSPRCALALKGSRRSPPSTGSWPNSTPGMAAAEDPATSTAMLRC
jgi:hypothetical protein